jgi:hypothetical protein
VGSLGRRLSWLEISFGPPQDPEQTALDEAIRVAPLEVIRPLYDAVNRVYGPPPSAGSDRIELAELWPELTPIEVEAVEKLEKIAESL